MSKAMEVGKQLVDLCNEGKGDEAMKQLYSDGIVSLEGPGGDASMQRVEGIGGVAKKAEWWFDNHEVHEFSAAGPFCGHRDDQFVVQFDIDVTFKPSGERNKMSEVGIYTLGADGKVAQEEFLYNMG